MLERNWADYHYLADGTPRQRAAYAALSALGIFTVLGDFSPVLAGTIPLNIDLPNSDLDIICAVPDLDAFVAQINQAFGRYENFRLDRAVVDSLETVIAAFETNQFEIEIFGQGRPVEQQNAYRHMIVEARMLVLGGESARESIQELKASGLKTEPAFARYFQLAGNPYRALLNLYPLSMDELRTYTDRITL